MFGTSKGRLVAASAFAVSLVIGVALMFLRYDTLTRIAQEQRRQARSFQLQKELNDVIAVFRAVEFYERTYLIGGDASARQYFETALASLGPEVDDVKPLLREDPIRARKFADIEHRLWQRVGMLREEVASRRLESAWLSTAVRDSDVIQPIQKLIDDEAAQVTSGGSTLYEGISNSLIEMLLMMAAGLTAATALILFLVSDLRRRQQVEAELRMARDSADAASRAKSLFVANISHEIRTPMTAIAGFSDLLLEDNLTSAERRQFGEAVQRNCRLLTQIIDDLLDLARAESGKLRVHLEPTTLREVIDDVTLTLGRLAAAKGTELIVNVDDRLPRRVMTDPSRLRQVLLNIVGNAVKFTAHGRVEVEVLGSSQRVGDELQLEFTVKDTGPGIRPEHQALLFKPFGQADASWRRAHGGTGLGLVLSRQLAAAMGGDVILAHSTPGEGSTFRIIVACPPLSTAPEAATAP